MKKNLLQLALIAFCGFGMPVSATASGSAEASPSMLPPLKTKIKIPVIIIDPGHGGEDHGTVSRSGLTEKEVVLDMAHRTQKYLKQIGFDVLMTRTSDEFIRLEDRVTFCQAHQGDLFLSIHANSAPNKQAVGFETFFHSPNTDVKGIEKYGGFLTYLSLDSKQKKSLKLAKLVQSEMEELTLAQNRGIKMAKFHVLKYSPVPAVLVETGFLSNPEEAARLTAPDYRNKIALALAQSIRRYCRW